MSNTLDLKYKILVKTIKQEILNFEHLSPEELHILLEEYCERLQKLMEAKCIQTK